MEILQWITDHGPGVVKIVTGIIAGASVITAATKTPDKRAKMALIYKLIEILALNIGRAKDKAK